MPCAKLAAAVARDAYARQGPHHSRAAPLRALPTLHEVPKTTVHTQGVETLSVALVGLDAHVVHVHAQIQGPATLQIVGLSEAQTRETGIRVRSALSQVGVDLTASHVIVHVTSEVPLRSGIDLAIAVAVLGALGRISIKPLSNTAILGELALAGDVRPVRGVLPALRGAVAQGITRAIVPRDNAREAAHAPGVSVLLVEHVDELVRYLAEGIPLETAPKPQLFVPSAACADMADVRNMASARRALEVAAAGGHNLLLVGSPGSGKTMLARRLSGILPPLTAEEASELTAVHSAGGLLCADVGLLTSRPFRAPHHTVSPAGLVGGVEPARPGEVSLAHGGVLFLDELPEFRRSGLDALGHALDEGAVITCRGALRATFPARTLVVGATNPCPCGWHGDAIGRCSCSPERVKSYVARLQGRLCDRFDMRVVLSPVHVATLQGGPPGESSSDVQRRVVAARDVQTERHRYGLSARTNSELSSSDLLRVVRLDAAGTDIVTKVGERLRLSGDGLGRVLRVARTIADLDLSDAVRAPHVAEALHLAPEPG